MKSAKRWLLAASLIVVVVWGWLGMEIQASTFSRWNASFSKTVSAAFPPDWSVLPNAMVGLVETLRIAIVATSIGLLGAIPFSFLAARGQVAPLPVSWLVKTILNGLRAIPSLILAVILVTIVGLGPLPAGLAIGVGSFVMLTTLFAETLENVDQAPLEAVRAVGGTPIQVFVYGMLPQTLPQFVTQTLYSWEINISAATITGIVGAGGIGMALSNEVHYLNWQKATVYIIVLALTIILVDLLSYTIRRRLA